MRQFFIFSLLLIMVACSDGVYYKQSFVIKDGQWSYDQPVKFTFEIKDSTSYYDLVLDVNHSQDYVYENLYVIIRTTFPSGEKVTDQVSLQLADHLDQWEGKCNKTSCDVSILLQNRIFFKEQGTHSIEIEQHNRENPLSGIHQMTLKIIEVID